MDRLGGMAASRPRRAAAVTLDAALLVTFGWFGIRRFPTTGRTMKRIVGSAAVQAAYFVPTAATFGGSPGQLAAGLRVVDSATGGRPGWRQSAMRWAVWAGPGIAARAVTSASRRLSSNAETALLDQSRRPVDEVSDDRDQLDEQLAAVEKGRIAAAWGPPAAVTVVLVVYRLTVGRGAHDRLSGTRLVTARPARATP